MHACAAPSPPAPLDQAIFNVRFNREPWSRYLQHSAAGVLQLKHMQGNLCTQKNGTLQVGLRIFINKIHAASYAQAMGFAL